jgi:hypothetical protein
MPQPVNYICTKCDFSGSDMSTWGAHYYIFGETLIPIKRTTALCYGCHKIVSVEVIESDDSSIGFHSDVFQSEQRNLALKDRTSGAKCLNCGSHDYEVIPMKKIPYPPPSHPIRSGLIHRVCGGRIYSEHDTPNLNFGNELPERYFNTEGEAVEKSELIE